jgi:hypothetical protein
VEGWLRGVVVITADRAEISSAGVGLLPHAHRSQPGSRTRLAALGPAMSGLEVLQLPSGCRIRQALLVSFPRVT